MRFFTRAFDLAEGDEADRIWRDYRAHFNSIAKRLPTGCTIIDALSLHDAVMKAIHADPDGARTISCIAGDLQRGYTRLDMRYALAPGVAALNAGMERLIEDEILRDEFDLSGTQFVHGLRFASGAEIEIVFVDLTVRCARVADRSGAPVEI